MLGRDSLLPSKYLWKERESKGHYHNLVQEMRLKDHSMRFNYLRMLPSTFDDLLDLVGPLLMKGTTNFRKPLPPELRVAVALRYLATGESQASLSYKYRIGRPTVAIYEIKFQRRYGKH